MIIAPENVVWVDWAELGNIRDRTEKSPRKTKFEFNGNSVRLSFFCAIAKIVITVVVPFFLFPKVSWHNSRKTNRTWENQTSLIFSQQAVTHKTTPSFITQVWTCFHQSWRFLWLHNPSRLQSGGSLWDWTHLSHHNFWFLNQIKEEGSTRAHIFEL